MTIGSDVSDDLRLIDRFVESWRKVGALCVFEDLDPVAAELCCGEALGGGGVNWRPLRSPTSRSALTALCAQLPAPFPPLYEQLLLSYRWAEVDLCRLRLLSNPPGPGLARLRSEIFKDWGVAEVLVSNGFVQLGKAPDVSYDPVCFDTRRVGKGGDCPVVRLDHEAIHCHSRIRKVAEVAPSFRGLLRAIIEDARQRPTAQI
jgi:hypothetical protein